MHKSQKLSLPYLRVAYRLLSEKYC